MSIHQKILQTVGTPLRRFRTTIDRILPVKIPSIEVGTHVFFGALFATHGLLPNVHPSITLSSQSFVPQMPSLPI